MSLVFEMKIISQVVSGKTYTEQSYRICEKQAKLTSIRITKTCNCNWKLVIEKKYLQNCNKRYGETILIRYDGDNKK